MSFSYAEIKNEEKNSISQQLSVNLDTDNSFPFAQLPLDR